MAGNNYQKNLLKDITPSKRNNTIWPVSNRKAAAYELTTLSDSRYPMGASTDQAKKSRLLEHNVKLQQWQRTTGRSFYLAFSFYNNKRDWGGGPAMLGRKRLVTVPKNDHLDAENRGNSLIIMETHWKRFLFNPGSMNRLHLHVSKYRFECTAQVLPESRFLFQELSHQTQQQ